jgi:predicted DNA-binding transcriptional regulator AlpA
MEEKLKKQQEEFLTILENAAMNISMACEKLGICRTTYYNWLEKEEFERKVDDLKESRIDYAESKLMINISKEKESSIFYFLNNQGRHRGYGDKLEISHSGASPTLVELVKEWQDEKKQEKNKTANLVQVLKNYERQSLNLKQIFNKLVEDENIAMYILDSVIESIGKEITVTELIAYFEQIPKNELILIRLKNVISHYNSH